MTWPVAFGLTILLEVPLYLAGLCGLRLAGWRRALVAAVASNVLTHPLLWLFLSAGEWSWTRTVGAEAIVVLVEAGVLAAVVRRGAGWAAVLALGANAASFAVGLALSAAVA